jgi:hypothetical protein
LKYSCFGIKEQKLDKKLHSTKEFEEDNIEDLIILSAFGTAEDQIRAVNCMIVKLKLAMKGKRKVLD